MKHEHGEHSRALTECMEAKKNVKFDKKKIVISPLSREEKIDDDTLIVHFVRHGEGEHNVYAAEFKKKNPDKEHLSPYGLPDCPKDPKLTDEGRKQAIEAGKALDSILQQSKHEEILVFSSPLMRCCQTTTGLLSSVEEKKKINVKIVELLRERMGHHICDMR